MFGFLRKRPLVSICVPAYRSQAFIAETLESALNQTVKRVEIVVSNDGAHPTPALEALRQHPKVRIFDRPRRLGWVANSDFVLSQARGAYFMLLPHDDVLAPGYLAACLDLLETGDGAFAACSDIASDRGEMQATEVRGAAPERVSHVMRDLFSAYSLRAVMRRRPRDREHLRLRRNPPTDFAADTTWMLQQACLGELRRVPQPLYWKRYRAGSTHDAWARLRAPALRAAWRAHCGQMAEIAGSRIDDAAVVARLLSHRLDPRRVAEAPAYLVDAMAQPGGRVDTQPPAR